MGLAATPEMLEPHSLHQVKPGPPGKFLPAQRQEKETGGAPLRLRPSKSRKRSREAPQRPTWQVQPTTNEVVRLWVFLHVNLFDSKTKPLSLNFLSRCVMVHLC